MGKIPLGQTGLEINQMVYGCMRLSMGDAINEGDAIKLLHHVWDAGVDLVDTADSFCSDDSDMGRNERLIAKALASYGIKSKIKIATKGGFIRPLGAWVTNGHPRHLKEACEASLKSLGCEQIFLYYLHVSDDDVPYAESLGAIFDLQKEGKIKHVGISNVDVEKLETAVGLGRIEAVQNRFNPFCLRDNGNGVLDKCIENKLSYFAYSPVGGGLGHGKVATSMELSDVGKALNVSPYRVALAWIMKHFPSVSPIIGTSRLESTDDCLEASKLELSKDQMDKLNEHFLGE